MITVNHGQHTGKDCNHHDHFDQGDAFVRSLEATHHAALTPTVTAAAPGSRTGVLGHEPTAVLPVTFRVQLPAGSDVWSWPEEFVTPRVKGFSVATHEIVDSGVAVTVAAAIALPVDVVTFTRTGANCVVVDALPLPGTTTAKAREPPAAAGSL